MVVVIGNMIGQDSSPILFWASCWPLEKGFSMDQGARETMRLVALIASLPLT